MIYEFHKYCIKSVISIYIIHHNVLANICSRFVCGGLLGSFLYANKFNESTFYIKWICSHTSLRRTLRDRLYQFYLTEVRLNRNCKIERTCPCSLRSLIKTTSVSCTSQPLSVVPDIAQSLSVSVHFMER